MQVLKFGGSSVANAENMARTVAIVRKALERDRTILVGSAIGGCTDALIRIGVLAAARDESYKTAIDALQEQHEAIVRELLPKEKHEEGLAVVADILGQVRSLARGVDLLGELSPRSLDAIQGCGELLSTRILAIKFASVGIAVKWVDSRTVIRTHNVRGHNVVDTETTCAAVQRMIDENPRKSLFVVPGFIASDEKGRMTTLGRGGSDYSASLYAVGSKARALETWKDVPGMMTANPAVVPDAQPIHHISYRAALELSHFGAKVIYPPTIQPVVAERIPIYVKCTFDPSVEGTLIEQNPPRGKNKLIGISNSDKIALLSLEGSGMVGVPGFSYRLFQTLSENDISIILITQASSVNTMCVAVAEKDAAKAKAAADQTFAYEISLGKLNPLKVETGYSIVCLVGDDMFNQSGTTGRMLAALGRRSISVRAVAQGSSERNISVIVRSCDADAAIKAIHDEFFNPSPYRDVNIFVAGFGGVAKSLLRMMCEQREFIAARTGKRLHLAGVSNSRKFLLDPKGLTLDSVDAIARRLEKEGRSAADDAFFEELFHLSLQHSVLVDCTASSDVACKYANFFRAGYNVVACNKIAFAAPLAHYRVMKEAAVENGASVRYETTVCSALPVLETLSRLVNTGDKVLRVDAVLSGTLSFLFNTYRGGTDGVRFADVVRQAQEKGFTEPDPRLDLSGRDVFRKLLILSREAGVPLEETDIEMTPLVPADCFKGTVDDFYRALEAREAEFAAAWKAADDAGKVQKFLACLEWTDGGYKASIGLRVIEPSHPLGTGGSGAVITSELYRSPIIIRGAGAGADNTASGVLNDILLCE